MFNVKHLEQITLSTVKNWSSRCKVPAAQKWNTTVRGRYHSIKKNLEKTNFHPKATSKYMAQDKTAGELMKFENLKGTMDSGILLRKRSMHPI